MRTSFFPPSSPLPDHSEPDASCWPLEEQPQPAQSPRLGGTLFLTFFFTFFRVLLHRQRNKIFHFASQLQPLCNFCISPILLNPFFGSLYRVGTPSINLALHCPWRGEAGASFLDFPSLPAQPSQSPSEQSSATDLGAPLSRHPHATAHPHPNSSHPQNRRFPLFALLQSSSPAIPTLPYPSHSLLTAPHWTCTGHASVERSSHSTRLK